MKYLKAEASLTQVLRDTLQWSIEQVDEAVVQYASMLFNTKLTIEDVATTAPSVLEYIPIYLCVPVEKQHILEDLPYTQVNDHNCVWKGTYRDIYHRDKKELWEYRFFPDDEEEYLFEITCSIGNGEELLNYGFKGIYGTVHRYVQLLSLYNKNNNMCFILPQGAKGVSDGTILEEKDIEVEELIKKLYSGVYSNSTVYHISVCLSAENVFEEAVQNKAKREDILPCLPLATACTYIFKISKSRLEKFMDIYKNHSDEYNMLIEDMRSALNV